MQTGDYITIGGLVLTLFIGICTIFFFFGGIKENVKSLTSDIKEIKIDIKGIKTELTALPYMKSDILELKRKIEGLEGTRFIVNNSPVQLNETGQKILKESGIIGIIEKNLRVIIEWVKLQNPPNAYEGQQEIINAVGKLKYDKALKDSIENGAFLSGVNVDDVLYVGAIYIRDRILKEIGLMNEDASVYFPNDLKK